MNSSVHTTMIRRIAVLTGVLLGLVVTSGGYAQGHDPQTPADLTSLHAAATKGNAQAEFAYGKALYEKQDPALRDQAALWIQKAADHGLAEAWYWLGYAGLGKEQPLVYFEHAAGMGYPPAFQEVFDGLLFRAGESADVDAAKRYADLARKLKVDLGVFSKEELTTIDRCHEAGSPNLPPGDRPSPARMTALGKADCPDYQTDAKSPADWQRYRECLLSQDPVDNNQVAEVYANGWGVKRNPGLAIALVCHASTVPAELDGMVAALTETRDQSTLKTPFRFCDYASSGMNTGMCSADSERIADKQRKREIARLTRTWTAPQKAAFGVLRAAAEAFYSEHAQSEQDMSGSAHDSFITDEESSLRAEFLKDIKQFESGKLPPHADFARADQRLNAIYRKIMQRKDWSDEGTITSDGIRKTEKLWITYRDAWVGFAASRYSDSSASDWKAWLTEQRIKQLQGFAS